LLARVALAFTSSPFLFRRCSFWGFAKGLKVLDMNYPEEKEREGKKKKKKKGGGAYEVSSNRDEPSGNEKPFPRRKKYLIP